MLAESLQAVLPEYRILCFHSRFIATDRARIEKNLLMLTGRNSTSGQRDKLIVVGTQVLEQSLDLDFDYMVTELCPMDLLLQRSGRLHRHKRNRPEKLKKAVLTVLLPDEQTTNPIYDDWILKQTEICLPNKLMIPACIPELVGAVYEAADEDDAMYQNYCLEISKKKRNAKEYCIHSEMLGQRRKNLLSFFLDDHVGDSQQAEGSVRDSEDTIEVLVLCKISNQEYALCSGQAKFDVTMPLDESEAKCISRERLRLPLYFSKYHFHETVMSLAGFPEKWLESHWLSGELLLLLNAEKNTELIGKKLHYSEQLGLTEVSEG